MLNQKTHTVEEALIKLQRYCTYQDRCHQEVRSKLKELKMIPQAIDHIIVKLIEDDFLNEERFAISFVRGKFRIKKWGRNRLRSELKRRDISKANINTALKEISEVEYIEVFDDLAKKRLESIKERNISKKKRKLADYLLYRGWESGLVYDKVRELVK